ncbi:MAG: hypothetical protein IBX62_02975 [Coriobacteriia bacterium]|nr:hypothetical protein [Coriobacteriia bacterium]
MRAPPWMRPLAERRPSVPGLACETADTGMLVETGDDLCLGRHPSDALP